MAQLLEPGVLEMKKVSMLMTLVFGLVLASTSWAGGGDSGTGGVAEMNVSGSQLLMMVGALVVLGLVIWLLAKFLNK